MAERYADRLVGAGRSTAMSSGVPSSISTSSDDYGWQPGTRCTDETNVNGTLCPPLFFLLPKVLIALYENDTPFEFRLLAPGDEQVAAEHEALWPLKRCPFWSTKAARWWKRPSSSNTSASIIPGLCVLIPEDPRAALDVRMMDRFFETTS